MESKVTSEQIFGKETAELFDKLERIQELGEGQIILISRSWFERLLEKILRRMYRF